MTAALITAFGGLLLAGASYLFTKKREREEAIRKEQLNHYKDFVAALSGIVEGEATAENQKEFALASNKLMLVAPQAVIVALRDFQNEIAASNNTKSTQRHDQLMSKLFLEMRKDLKIKPKDNPQTFAVGLWASGCPTKMHRDG